MTTAIASSAAALVTHVSPRPYPSIASAPPASSEPAAKKVRNNSTPEQAAASAERGNSTGKSSPRSLRGLPPIIKKEPGSPPLSARPRPKRLDLSASNPTSRGPNTARPSAPLTARDSAGLAIHDVGIACLSPGFQTNDPGMREQLQRSLDVRDQQRMIIEARQKGQKPGTSYDKSDANHSQDTTLFGVQMRTPTTSRRKGPPPGLSINAPSAAHFANDRVIQSAPMNQTFTGLRPGEHPFTRHSQLGPSGLSQTSHIHHVPATQTNNRLPPIADVFANDRLEAPSQNYHSPSQSSHSHGQPLPSPGLGPPPRPNANQPPMSARSREFRSAEEAVQGLSGGRDDLMPKVVHYGGVVQPPTPPSPLPPTRHEARHQSHTTHHNTQPGASTDSASTHHHHHHHHHTGAASNAAPPDPAALHMNGRRRGREEYERDNGSSPPVPIATTRSEFVGSSAQPPKRTARLVDDWQASLTGAEKREEFLRLCERAWDLFHS